MSQVATKELAATSNANEAAVSTPKEIDIAAIVSKVAAIKIKTTKQGDSTTRERVSLNREKLVNACRSEWKSLRAQDKLSRVPDEIDSKIIQCCEEYITHKIGQIHPLNALTFNRKIVPDFRNDMMVEKVTAVGKNLLRLEEQKLFCDIAIRETEEHLTRIQAMPATTPDREVKVKEKISKLQKMLLWIETNIADIKKNTQ